MLYGAIEAGGTKFVCAVSNDKLEIIERISVPTTFPEETMKLVMNFFSKYQIESIGIGSFGPIDIKKNSETYGYITSTPKKGWKNFDFLGQIKSELDVPLVWDTDVNVAAYGEFNIGAAEEVNSCLYLTVGTGIGGGAVFNGKILEGYSHPEMGHLLIRKNPEDDFEGACPFHGDCLEGLASGKAIEIRNGKKGTEIDKEHRTWTFEAKYIAQALVSYTLVLSPEKIILGGGVMKHEGLLDNIKKEFQRLLADYVDLPDLDEYITRPKLGDNSGIMGCLILAKENVNNRKAS